MHHPELISRIKTIENEIHDLSTEWKFKSDFASSCSGIINKEISYKTFAIKLPDSKTFGDLPRE